MTTRAPRMTAGQRREQLLDATKAIAARQGFHSVSIEAVAREAGITRPIVYGHFGDLAGLLEALVTRESRRALAQLGEVLPAELASSDPRERLIGAMRAYLDVVGADSDTWRLVLMPSEGAPSSLHDQIARGRDAIIDQLASAVRPGIGPGGRPPDPELTARMLSAFADEAARLHLGDPARYPVERLMDQARWSVDQLGA